tara:strand:- start:10653 stop:10865 length:213 start_codon:yes stop_codon:yes gene_type:complete
VWGWLKLILSFGDIRAILERVMGAVKHTSANVRQTKKDTLVDDAISAALADRGDEQQLHDSSAEQQPEVD